MATFGALRVRIEFGTPTPDRAQESFQLGALSLKNTGRPSLVGSWNNCSGGPSNM